MAFFMAEANQADPMKWQNRNKNPATKDQLPVTR